jgi:hypothetical protein
MLFYFLNVLIRVWFKSIVKTQIPSKKQIRRKFSWEGLVSLINCVPHGQRKNCYNPKLKFARQPEMILPKQNFSLVKLEGSMDMIFTENLWSPDCDFTRTILDRRIVLMSFKSIENVILILSFIFWISKHTYGPSWELEGVIRSFGFV